MKRQILISLILLSSVLTMNGQIYTPSGTIQGSSGNNNVGIGTNNPKTQLHLISGGNVGGAGGEIGFSANDGYNPMALIKSSLYFASNGGDAGDLCFYTREMLFNPNRTADNLSLRLIIKNNGKAGFGVTDPRTKVEINTGLPTSIPTYLNTYDGMALTDGGLVYGRIGMANLSAGGSGYPVYLQTGDWSGAYYYNILLNPLGGNVGIGVLNPGTKLDVAGTIRAQEVKVCLSQGCDFVFKKDYKLMDLKELETFVKTNQHLPEIAPEKVMVENGVNMKELQMKLLQKIEELTLYTIEQNKKIEQLQEQNKELQLLKEKIEKIEAASK